MLGAFLFVLVVLIVSVWLLRNNSRLWYILPTEETEVLKGKVVDAYEVEKVYIRDYPGSPNMVSVYLFKGKERVVVTLTGDPETGDVYYDVDIVNG